LHGTQRKLSDTTPYRTNPIFSPRYAAGLWWKFLRHAISNCIEIQKRWISNAATPVKRTLEAEKVDVNRYLSGIIK
jgi:hypothetical protein